MAIALELGAAADGLPPLVLRVALGIVLGILLANVADIPDWATPGLTFVADPILKAGGVPLGFNVVFFAD